MHEEKTMVGVINTDDSRINYCFTTGDLVVYNPSSLYGADSLDCLGIYYGIYYNKGDAGAEITQIVPIEDIDILGEL